MLNESAFFYLDNKEYYNNFVFPLENILNILYYMVIKSKGEQMLKVSTKGRYALRMLLDLAKNKDAGFISLKEIAERQGISKQYLEQIVTLLNTSNVLRANRGKQGGYMLAKEPSQITVGQILRITEGSLAPVACLEDDTNYCERADSCITLPMWKGLNSVISEYLNGISLQSMLEQTPGLDNYVI